MNETKNSPVKNSDFELMITNLPSHAKEEDILELLLELNPRIKPKKIDFPRSEESMITNEEFGYLTLFSLEEKLRLLFLSPRLCLKNQELEFKEPIPAFEMKKLMEREREHQIYVRGLNKKMGMSIF